MQNIRVGINGFGRIGRLVFRATQLEAAVGDLPLEVVGINDLSGVEAAAHLLKYDSTHGRFAKKVLHEDGRLIVDKREIPMSATKNPAEIPWREWGCDLVLECTGAFKSKADFMRHIEGGAKRVLVSAPAEGVDLTIVYGINHDKYDPGNHHVISNASCTTNCLAPIAKVLHETFTIEHGLMTTIHSYTNDQQVLDAAHKDLRRARAASLSMIPTSTGAAKAVGLVLPELKGKIDGVAIRVPTPNVSLVDLVFKSAKPVSANAINEVLRRAAENELRGILGVEDQPLVSVDYNGVTLSSIVDTALTMVSGQHMAKVFAWYDNEIGFSNRMIDVVRHMARKGL